MTTKTKAPTRWTQEDVQRVLYHVVTTYENTVNPEYIEVKGGVARNKKNPRRFILFGRRLPGLGGDSELLRDAVRIARETLKDNNWWPNDKV